MSPRHVLGVVVLVVAVGSSLGPTARAGSFCGNGIVDGNEQCDGTPCCLTNCRLAQMGSVCGQPSGQCDTPDLCNVDGTCIPGNQQPDGVPCDDGDACTTGDACIGGQCIAAVRVCTVADSVAQPLGAAKPGKVIVTVTCTAPGGVGGGTCSAAAFLPPLASGPVIAAADGTLPAACDVTRQITRTAKKSLDANGVAKLKLRLNKLARRLIRQLPASDAISVNVCTTIQFPSGDPITLVDVVNVARHK